MAHTEVLSVLARLQVDPAFRRAFLEDPTEALASLQLSDTERRALAALDRASVIRVGQMADSHRLARIQEHVPWVDLGLRPDLRAHVIAYLEQVPPGLLNRDEALAFCVHLESSSISEPPYLPELARLERLRISLAWGLSGVTSWSESFVYPLGCVLPELVSPGWPVVLPEPSRVEIKKVPAIPAVMIRW